MARRRIKLSRALSSGEALLVDVTGRAQISLSGPPPVSGGGLGPATLTTIGTVSISTDRGLDEDGRSEMTAPGGCMFTAETSGFLWDDIYAQPWKDLDYFWTFDDPGYYTRHDTDDFPAASYYDVEGVETLIELGDPVPAGATYLGADRNRAYGPWVKHVFPHDIDFGGQDFVIKTVTLEVRRGDTGALVDTVTHEVKVYNPDVVFAGTSTILVSATGDTANASAAEWHAADYPGATLVNTHAQALSYIAANGSGTANYRVLFRRGESPVTELIGNSSAHGNARKFFYGSYGNSADPAPRPTNPLAPRFDTGLSPSHEYESATYGLDFLGPYDPENPDDFTARRTAPGSQFYDGIELLRGRHKTVWDCEISGYERCITGEINTSIPGFSNATIGNTMIRNWADYGIYIITDPEFFGMCGVWIKQSRLAVVKSGKLEGTESATDGIFADHGPLRCMSPGSPSAFNLIDIRSTNSWAGEFQPCTRYNIRPTTEDSPNVGDFPSMTWERVRSEGGPMVFQVASTAGSGISQENPAEPCHILFQGMYSLTYYGSGNPVASVGISGPVVRSSILVRPGQGQIGTSGNFFDGRNSVTEPNTNYPNSDGDPQYFSEACFNEGIEVYSCTLVDLQSSTADPIFVDGLDTPWAYFLEENNIQHMPNRTPSTDAALDTTQLWECDYPGIRRGEGGAPYTPDASTAMPPGTPATFRVTGSTPNAAVTSGKVAVRDFAGKLRGSSPVKGAW